MVVSQSVGIAVEIEHYGAMQEPVEHGRSDSGVTENITPFADSAVGGDHDGGLQIALRHNLKQCGCCFTGQRKVAQFVELCRHRDKSTYADSATMPTLAGGRC